MDLLTRTDIDVLTAQEPGEHVSAFLPTRRDAGDPLRLRNLLDEVHAVLVAHGTRRPDVDTFLEPARHLQDDARAWDRMSDGLAVYLRPGAMHVYRVPVPLPEVAVVGDRFVVGPILRMVTEEEHFVLVALDRHDVRLLEGTRGRLEEVDLAEVPTSLRDLQSEARGRSTPLARPLGRGAAVFYGHGGGDESDRKDEVRAFFRTVAGGIAEVLRDRRTPMVLAGLPEAVAMYRDVNPYAPVLDVAVEGAPRSAEELHAAAWPLVADHAARAGRAAVDRLGELLGTGRATTDPAAAAGAAQEGRVETLLLPLLETCWASAPHVVELGDGAVADCELADDAAVATLRTGGRVVLVPAGDLPGAVGAVLRY